MSAWSKYTQQNELSGISHLTFKIQSTDMLSKSLQSSFVGDCISGVKVLQLGLQTQYLFRKFIIKEICRH